jgi:transcriptional regulator with XRE-family HTH domain
MIGRQIRARRRQLKMTQAQLAAAMGHCREWVSSMERGRSELTVYDLQKAAKALGVSVSELLDGQ